MTPICLYAWFENGIFGIHQNIAFQLSKNWLAWMTLNKIDATKMIRQNIILMVEIEFSENQKA